MGRSPLAKESRGQHAKYHAAPNNPYCHFNRNVMNLDPSNAKARLGMAEFLLSIGDRNSARKEALEVLKTKPTHPEALLLLAKVSSTEQEMKEATSLNPPIGL